MEIDSAIQLIINGVDKNAGAQAWADLGAGSGLFSQALSAILPDASTIYAIDKSYKAGQSIKTLNAANKILLSKKDFVSSSLDIPVCDGLLMANSLHFVEDKLTLLQKIRRNLQPAGRIIIVEYDTDQSNRWVPFPVSCKNLHKLITAGKLGSLQKLAEQTSLYQTGGMYSALIV